MFTFAVQNNPEIIPILKILYLVGNMNTELCVITICRSQKSIKWKKVIEYVIAKGQTNNTLPSYLQVGNTICLDYYNRIMVNYTLAFQQHAQAGIELSPPPPPPPPPSVLPPLSSLPPPPSVLSFSEAIGIITKILYIHENKEKKLTIYSFDDFHAVMEGEDARLKVFFNELYILSNSSSKNEISRARAKKQLLFICYFLCEIRNKFVNDAKIDLTIYLDSTSISNASIDTLADLSVTTTF